MSILRTTTAALAAGLVAGLALGSPARADDKAKTQSVTAGGITFEAPGAWKPVTPSGSMRKAQLKVSPAEGDTNGAEVIVFALPGGAGSIDQNIERWRGQFKGKDGNPPKADVKAVKGKNGLEISRVEMAGHFFPANFPGLPKQADQPNARFIAGVVVTPEAGYFIRLVGPEKTVNAAQSDFDKLLGTVSIGVK